jgi:hypothetical protein
LGVVPTMIIRPDGDSLLFITQPDHACLAADAIAHWRADGFAENPRRDVILLATREHDNGWVEEDAATHLDGEGNPLDFVSVPATVRQSLWPRAVDRMAHDNAYAAALIAQHAIAVYSASRSDAGWTAFFATLSERRQALTARADVDEETLQWDYRFVNAADRMSLAFCTGWTQPLESYGRRIILNQHIVEITPDPFDRKRVPLRIPARRLPKRPYRSSAELRAALDDVTVEFLVGEAVGAS